MKCRGRPLEARRSRPQCARDSGEPESSSRTTLPDTHRPAPGPRERNANERLCCTPGPAPPPGSRAGRPLLICAETSWDHPHPRQPRQGGPRGPGRPGGGRAPRLRLGALRRAGGEGRASVWEPRAGAGMGGAPPRPPAAETLFRAINPDLLPTVHTLCAKKPLFSFPPKCDDTSQVFFLLTCASKTQVRRQTGKPRGEGDAAPPTSPVDCSAEGAASAAGWRDRPAESGPALARAPDSRSCSSPATASGVAGPGKRPSGAGRLGWFPGRIVF